MNTQTALTGAAVALGVFALWYVFKGPGRVQAEPTAQAQRDAGLYYHWNTVREFQSEIPGEPPIVVDLLAGIRGQRGYD